MWRIEFSAKAGKSVKDELSSFYFEPISYGVLLEALIGESLPITRLVGD